MRLIVWVVRLLYAVMCLFPQRRTIVLLSRQSARPFDYALLEPELSRRFPDRQIVWCCVAEIGKMSVPLMIKQLWHVATAELCLVDGYVPAVSLPRSHRALVVQMWHAPGAIKRFGYQSVGTPAGRSPKAASTLRMHRGYDLVIAGMPGAVGFFSEAFDMPAQKILPLGLPRIDYLVSDRFADQRATRYARAERAMADALAAAGAPDDPAAVTVLYAPTFRKANADERWLEHAVEALSQALAAAPEAIPDAAAPATPDAAAPATPAPVRLVVAGHPLEREDGDAAVPGVPVAYVHGVPTIDLLHAADYVATDYSTVAFEAGYASRRTLFYVPDIEEYRLSPGLNIDPLLELPTLSFTDAEGVARVVRGNMPYDSEAFDTFMRENARGVLGGSVSRIADMLEDRLARREG